MAERTFRRPVRPIAYAILIALAAALLATGVAGTWLMARHSAETSRPIGVSSWADAPP